VRELNLAGRCQVGAPVFIARAEKAPRRFQNAIVVVLDVILAPLVAIADRDNLDVRAGKQLHGDVESLVAHADRGQRDAITGRNITRPAEHVTRNNHESRCTGDKFAT